MSFQANDDALIKKPHVQTAYTKDEVLQFAKTADRKTGPQFFMKNFFYIQHPTRGKIKYQPYPYQDVLIDSYHDYRFSINMLSR